MKTFFRSATICLICFLLFVPFEATISSTSQANPDSAVQNDHPKVNRSELDSSPSSLISIDRDRPVPPELIANPNQIEDELNRGDVREYSINLRNISDELIAFHTAREIISEPEEDNVGRSVRQTSENRPVGPYRDDPGDIVAVYNVPLGRTEGMAWDDDHLWIWGVNYDEPGRLYAMDPENGEITVEVNLPDNHMGLFYRESILYVGGDTEGNGILCFDTNGDALQPFNVPFDMDNIYISENEDFLFTNLRRSGVVNVFIFDGLEQVGTIRYGEAINDSRIYAIEWIDEHPDGQLWLAGEQLIYECFIDENWNCQLVQSFPRPGPGNQYCGLAHDDDNLWFGYREDPNWYVIDDGIDEVRWLRVEPESGEIEPGGDMDIFVHIDATRLIGGDYEGAVYVLPDDEDEPDLEIFVSFNITPAPVLRMEWEIGQDENVINWNEYFAEVYTGREYAVPLTIKNIGSEILHVSEINSNNEVFNAEPGEIFLGEDESQIVGIAFSPPAMDQYEAILTIICNDPGDEEFTIDLRAEAFDPPVIFVDPLEFNEELLTGDTSEHWFNIQNEGDAPLVWNSRIELIDEPDRDGLQRSVRSISSLQPNEGSGSPYRDEPGEILAQYDIPYERLEGLAWDDDQSLIWGLNYSETGCLFSLDPDNGEIVEEFRIGERNMGLFYRDRIFYTGRNQEGSFVINLFNTEGELVDQFRCPVEGENIFIAASEEYLFTNVWSSGVIQVWNFDNLERVGLIRYAGVVGGEEIYAIEWVEYHPEGQLWLCSSNMIFQCSVDNEWNMEVVQSFRSPGGGRAWCGIAHDGVDMWIGRFEDMSIYRIDDGALESRWLSIEPKFGEIPPGGDTDVFVRLDATRLMGGDYEGSIHVLSNDVENPNAEVFVMLTVIPASVFQARWAKGQDENQINFNRYYDEVYTNGSYPVEVSIRNLGSDVLNIERVDFESDAFSVQPENLSVQIGEEAVLTVIFSPREMDEYRANMLITCNDPGNEEFNIELIAVALDPPVIFVDPMEVEDFLFTGNSSEHWINITNAGAAPLSWISELEIFIEPDLDNHSRSVRSISSASELDEDGKLRAPYRDDPGEILNTYDIPFNGCFGLAWDYDNSLVWGANFEAPTCIYAFDPNNNNIATQFALWGGVYGLFYLDGVIFIGGNGRDEDLIFRFDTEGNELEPWQAPVDMRRAFVAGSSEYFFTHTRRTGIVNVFDLENLDQLGVIRCDQFINGEQVYAIVWVENHPDGQLWMAGDNFIYQFFVDDDWNCELVQRFAIPEQGLDYNGLTHDGENLLYAPYGRQNIFVIDDGIDEPNWISYEPKSGEIDPDFDTDIFITLDADDLFGGLYEAFIHIFSNDPVSPEVEIHVALEVEGAPNIDLEWEFGMEDNRINWNQYFDEVYVLGQYEIPVTIANSGTDVLLIENISIDDEAFSTEDWEEVVNPREETVILVSFAPDENREYAGELTIVSNDPDDAQVMVELVAQAFEPPDIVVDPMEIDQFLLSELTVEIPIILANIGEAPLNWSTEFEFVEEFGRDNPARHVRSVNPLEQESQLWVPYRDDPWASIVIEEGVLQSGMDVDLRLEINTDDLFTDNYEAFLHILSNDPDEPDVEVHITLEVEGVPDIELEWELGMDDNLINWNEYLGEVFITGTYAVPLTIHNRGTEALNIENIAFDNEVFSVEEAEFSVPFGESVEIDVLFSPDNSEVYEGAVTIFSDDRDEPEVSINLIGRGFAPPIIEIDPESIGAEIRTGERTEQVFWISNVGEATLRWRAATELVERDEFADQGPTRDAPGDIISAYPVPYDANSGMAWDGELIWGVSVTNHRMYSLNPETGRPANVHRIHLNPNGIAFVNGQYWIGHSDQVIYSYDINGNLVNQMNIRSNCDIASDQDTHLFLNDGEGNIWVYDLNGLDIVGCITFDDIVDADEVASIDWSDDCNFGQLWLLGDEMVYQLYVDEEWNAALYQSFEWNADRKNAGVAHDGIDLWHGMRGERNWYRNDDGIGQVSWLNLDTNLGEVAENDDEVITVSLDAFDLFGGVHEANIHILSNDPDDGDVIIPVILLVSGDPMIETSPIAHPNEGAEVVSCGTAFVDEPGTTLFTISNTGTSDLIINRIESSNPEFDLQAEAGDIIEPQTSFETEIIFQPGDHGLREGVINIYTNAINVGAGDEQGHIWFLVEGNGVRHPEISTYPGAGEQLSLLNPVMDEPVERHLKIFNTGPEGAVPLRFVFSSSEQDIMNQGSSESRQAGSILSDQSYKNPSRNESGPSRDDPGDVIAIYAGSYAGIGGLAWAEGQMWGVSYTHEGLFAFDPEIREVTFSGASNAAPTGMTYDGTYLWIGQRFSHWIYLYDLEGNQIERVLLDFGGIGGIASDQRRYIFVNCRDDSLIHVISMATREELTTFEFESAMANQDIWSIEWVPEHPDGQLWGLARYRIYQAAVNDLWETEPVQDFRCTAYHRFNGLAHDGVNMWHGSWTNNNLIVVDDGNEEITQISWLGIEPTLGWVDRGDSLDVILTIYSRLLEDGGEYFGEILIQSNDPENLEIAFEIRITSEMVSRYFESFTETEQSHHLTIRDIRYEDATIVTGCEVGVITPGGILAGAAVWDNEPDIEVSLEAFGDDPRTEEVEGFRLDEGFRFRAWDYVANAEWEFVYDNIFDGPITWQPGGQSTVSIECSDEFSVPDEPLIPQLFFLSSAYPNPFNSVTNIEYGLPISGRLSIEVFDIGGRKVKTLINESLPAGQYATTWNGAGVVSGVYLIMMKTNGFNVVRKVTLIR